MMYFLNRSDLLIVSYYQALQNQKFYLKKIYPGEMFL